MAPGKALDLGCGEGQNSVWLAAARLDRATPWTCPPSAIAEARDYATAAGVDRTIVFEVADIAGWAPVSRYDLVFCTFALPARGMGRSRMLDMAAAAVAPGGTILLTEFDVSLRRDGWMAEKYLVSIEELERHLGGFRVERSAVRTRPPSPRLRGARPAGGQRHRHPSHGPAQPLLTQPSPETVCSGGE